MGKPAHLKELKAFKGQLARRFPVERMILFGSRATGRARRDSDFDLLIVSSSFRGVRSLERPRGLYLAWPLNAPVDILCYTPEEFARMKSRPTLVREAARHGIAI